MATTYNQASVSGGLTAAFHRVVDGWRRERGRRARADQVRRELNAHTDRELGDLGLSRADIPAIARAAYEQA